LRRPDADSIFPAIEVTGGETMVNTEEESGGPQSARTNAGDPRDAARAEVHELSERLTSINNYLEAALQLSVSDPPGMAMPERLIEALRRAVAQSELANAAIVRLRGLLAPQ
jgi:hypothetical protein